MASDLVRLAVKGGKLIKSPICEICGIEANTHGHHFDYTKPLEVLWLCPQCHRDIHKKLSEIGRQEGTNGYAKL